jgi:type VI secretion system secreted protein VgrG
VRGFNSTEPKLYGLQSALVVGPQGGEIHTDEHGRVRLQFHWDRQGRYDENSSAWVRVASSWAGQGFGALAVPRVGQEVLVQWLDGNPDRPLVTGRVYNAAQLPARLGQSGGLPANQAVSGWSTRELHGAREQQLRFDDTSGQISTQLASAHGHSQLNLGFLTQPRRDGTGKARGEGFELRSDDSGAIRSAKSLLISAWKRLDASDNQLSREEHLGLMQDCLDLFKSLGQYAAGHQALPVDAAPQTELKDDLHAAAAGSNTEPKGGGGTGGKPTLSLTAPAGIATTTPKTILSYAGVNLDSVAQQHLQCTAGQRLSLNAGQGIGLFAHQGGITAIAHHGKLLLQSQHDDIEANAAHHIKWSATNGNLVGMAKKIVLIAEDGSFLQIGDGITLGTRGVIAQKAAGFPHSGPATLSAELPAFGTGKPDQKFKLHYGGASGTLAALRRFEITMSDGSVKAGTSDAQGLTELLERDAMHIAQVRILSD